MATGQVTASNVRGSGRDAPLRFGWRMPMWDPAGAPATSWLPAVRGNLAALRGKYDSVWLSDHFVPGTPWMPPEPDTLECWTATAHFSAAFPEYQYGQIVMGNNYRHPSLLAKAASTMQVLTGGKLILGIGAGWMESEYRMYGYEMPRPAVRIQQLDEACQIIRRMWTESPASFQGRHYTIDEAYANPLPDPRPADHDRRERRAVDAAGRREARRLVGVRQPLARASTAARPACWPSTARPSAATQPRSCTSGSARSSRWRTARPRRAPSPSGACSTTTATEDTRLVGTPEQIAERLEERMEIGVRHFILRFLDFPHTDQALRFAAEVAPRLRAASSEAGAILVSEPADVRAPRYLGRFRCIGPACEDHCCAGWGGIDVDPPTAEAYRQLTVEGDQRVWRLNLVGQLQPNPEAWPDEGWPAALIPLPADTPCPFFGEDRLCTIQGALGEELLPSTCDTFPRQATQIDERIDLAGRLSCPRSRGWRCSPRTR